MKVTQNAINGISESLDFQKFPRRACPQTPPNKTHIHLLKFFFQLSLIKVPLQLCETTVFVEKKKIIINN